MKINCVVVTYNRLDLLKECLKALEEQTFRIHKIFIINNHSTDQTATYLENLKENPNYDITNLPENIGGAGGFSEGIKRAAMDGCDWIWVMDDDTIPHKNALEELIKATKAAPNIGFICSKVIWTDGKVHEMNVPRFDLHSPDGFPLNYYSDKADVLMVKSASFVSILISTETVRSIGLPIKEFFIWGDDTEYTTRIYNSGYTCLYAGQSVALHKTKTNYVSNIKSVPADSFWKFKYGIRNELYLRKGRKSKLIFFFSALNFYRRQIRHAKKRKKSEKKELIRIVRKSFWKGFSFKPTIEYLPE